MEYRVRLSDGSWFLVDEEAFLRIQEAFGAGVPGSRFITGLQTLDQPGVRGGPLIHLNVDQIVKIEQA